MKSTNEDKETKKINWKTIVAVITFIITLLALLAVDPNTFKSSVREWWNVVKSITSLVLLTIIIILLVWIVRLRRKLKAESTTATNRGRHRFNSLVEASHILRKNIVEFSQTPGIKDINVIASTGASFLTLVKEKFYSPDQVRNIHFKLLLINPDFPEIDKCGSHWKDEVNSVVQELNNLKVHLKRIGSTVSLDWKFYDCFPSIHGIMFEDTELLFGFFHCVQEGNKHALKGAEKPYLYLLKNDENSGIYFEAFNSWFKYNWKEKRR
jgi:hypothetical protein